MNPILAQGSSLASFGWSWVSCVILLGFGIMDHDWQRILSFFCPAGSANQSTRNT